MKIKSLEILNTREIKEITKLLDEQFGFNKKLDYVYLINKKDKIFLVNRDIEKIDFKKLGINSLGMYFAEKTKTGLRLSIEGSQLIGPKAKKNIVEISNEEMKSWLKGENLEKETDADNFVIIRSGDDYLGCGKAKEGLLLNHVPKTRRISGN